MSERIDFETLDRYLNGTATPEEARLVEQRAAADPAVHALLTGLRVEPGRAPIDWNTDRAWQKMQVRLPRKRAAGRVWAIAAVLVVGLGIGVVLRNWDRVRGGEGAMAAAEYVTAAGARREVSLPDGSRIVLGASSRLVVPQGLAAAERTVELRGEAFFEVAPDAQHPFIVRAGRTETRVLGTRFNVATLGARTGVEVVVATGRVLVRGDGAPEGAILGPGRLARIDTLGRLSLDSVDVGAYTSWTEGRLQFRDVRLADALPKLERWFDLEIEIDDPQLGDARLTAFFDDQQSQRDVLDAIAATLGARYEQSGRTIRYAR